MNWMSRLRRLVPTLFSQDANPPQALPATRRRFVLFLDFDGVLHPGTTGTMRLVADLESLLARYPDVFVVISSSWRMGETLEELRAWFSPSIAHRIIDVTPILDQTQPAARHVEVDTWLAENPTEHWRALDDEASLYRPGCPWLIVTDPRTGLTAQTLARLEAEFVSVGLTAVAG